MSPMFVNYETNFFRNNASSYINLKAPVICKEITVIEAGGVWYNSEYVKKKTMRKAEKLYHKNGND